MVDGDMIKLKLKLGTFQNSILGIRIVLASQTIRVLGVNHKAGNLNCLNIDGTIFLLRHKMNFQDLMICKADL